MIRKSFTKLKRIIFSGLVMSLCTFVFNPTTPANAAVGAGKRTERRLDDRG